MAWWQAALFGLGGGLCVEALELYTHIRRSRRRWNWRRPIPQGMAAFVVSVVIRVGVGGTVAAVMAWDGQIVGAIGAFGAGVAAPLVIERLFRLVPLTVDGSSITVPASVAPEPLPTLAPAPPQPSQVQGAQASNSPVEGGGNAP
ncbi:hypothetical protein [Actinomadura terrae]|uniref:hypothetical protein n=1 Tax=Actinomadura terrae TaxID=604353 RepID=UPI001FA818D6|nr:hypothetical protein [Actinomadura terrae]